MPASRPSSTASPQADVLAENMLFATLDPTSRAIDLPHGEKAILSDTVGFISDLPTMLVAAFRATLEDVIEADVLLHVRDVSRGDGGRGRGRGSASCATSASIRTTERSSQSSD
jgi:50S ribosomal subunit-associated GTPase HflX